VRHREERQGASKFLGRNLRHGRPVDEYKQWEAQIKAASQSACACMGSLTSFEDGDPGTQMLTEHPSSTIPTVDLAGRGFAAAAFGSSCALRIPAMTSSASGEPLGDSRGVPIPPLGVPFADIAPK
jgi:hypothetical protein